MISLFWIEEESGVENSAIFWNDDGTVIDGIIKGFDKSDAIIVPVNFARSVSDKLIELIIL